MTAMTPLTPLITSIKIRNGAFSGSWETNPVVGQFQMSWSSLHLPLDLTNGVAIWQIALQNLTEMKHTLCGLI
jgi:hypothetical protein